jgi:DNA/RNA-binding domain of Phe-tRNA-synthetase-like protein
MLELTERCKATYPDAHAGLLILRNVANPPRHAALEQRKLALEDDLRRRYAGQDRPALLSNPVLQAYDRYYKQFKKTYHVQLQLESILFKHKSIPSVAALVEAMFMAEIDGLLLTAGHDLDTLHRALALDVATGSESYVLLRGEAQALKAGDMFIRDGEGVISSIVYGPDQRTQITSGTVNAAFTIYAPPGIQPDDVHRQLEAISENVLLFAPDAIIERLEVLGAG